MLIILLYLLVILSIIFLQKKEWFHSVFKANKKVSWIISGLSLYMFYLSVDQGQFLSGIIAEHGMKGLWMVWAGLLGAFVVPLVFAPFWQKMDFITDNQFLLFRFPGKSGRILHLFRALYVGGLVVSLTLCFHVLGFARVAQTYFDIDPNTAILITGLILCAYSLKNVLDLKLKIDFFHALIYFISLIIIIYSIWQASNGWDDLFRYFEKQPDKKLLFPTANDSNDWFSLVVFLGIQWWSCYLFDGGGPEMARYTAVNGKKNAVLTGLLPIGISVILSFFIVGHILFLLGMSSVHENHEINYVKSLFLVLPEVLKPLVFLGFFGMFISTAESLLNWGASFLTIDAYREYINPNASEKNIRFISFTTMVGLSVLAMVFALQVDSLQSLIKVTFSIAAGVAPVYILRWVWFRINAWSQLSAMLSSAVFTLVYPKLHAVLPLKHFSMEESRVLVVTVLTSLVWLLVTFFTPNNSKDVRLKMLPIIESQKGFMKRLFLALILGLILMLVVSGCWWLIINR